jgi:hypothetical protein
VFQCLLRNDLRNGYVREKEKSPRTLPTSSPQRFGERAGEASARIRDGRTQPTGYWARRADAVEWWMEEKIQLEKVSS